MGTSPLLWGFMVWRVLHLVSSKLCMRLRTHHDPRINNKWGIYRMNWQTFVETLVHILPCGACRFHGMQYIRFNSPRRVNTPEALQVFAVSFHNDVSHRNSKVTWTTQRCEEKLAEDGRKRPGEFGRWMWIYIHLICDTCIDQPVFLKHVVNNIAALLQMTKSTWPEWGGVIDQACFASLVEIDSHDKAVGWAMAFHNRVNSVLSRMIWTMEQHAADFHRHYFNKNILAAKIQYERRNAQTKTKY